MRASPHSCASVHNLLLCARTHSFGSHGSDFPTGKQREWERVQSEPANPSRPRASASKHNVTTATLVRAADRRGACWEERWRRAGRLKDRTLGRRSPEIWLTSVNTKPGSETLKACYCSLSSHFCGSRTQARTCTDAPYTLSS